MNACERSLGMSCHGSLCFEHAHLNASYLCSLFTVIYRYGSVCVCALAVFKLVLARTVQACVEHHAVRV